jgi:hypothetical protein
MSQPKRGQIRGFGLTFILIGTTQFMKAKEIMWFQCNAMDRLGISREEQERLSSFQRCH